MLQSREQAASVADIRVPRPTIDVTQANIDMAMRKSSSHCMIADSIRDALPSATCISVDLQTIRFTMKDLGVRLIYLTPRIAQHGIVQFDRGIKPAPFLMKLRRAQVTVMRLVIKKKRKDTRKRVRTPEGRITVKDSGPAIAGIKVTGGRKLEAPNAKTRKGEIPNVIGGRAPNKPHPSIRREFGMRAFTLDDVVSEEEAEGGAES